MNENRIFWKIFARRSGISFFIIILLFLSCILRIASISTLNYSAALANTNKLKITVSKCRGSIYDCNMVPITNNTKKYIAVVPPDKTALTALSKVLNENELAELEIRLTDKKPVKLELSEKISVSNIVIADVYETDKENLPAVHLIGYTDNDLKGVAGIEKAYDGILSSEKEITVYYDCNAKGEILEGVKPEINYNSSLTENAVKTTLDINLQMIAEEAALNIERGAIIICESKTGKIRAMVSMPHFNPQKTADYLNDSASPLLNRAINSYNVGSIFKPCVAAAGIENKKGDFCYFCNGKTEIEDRIFKCHNLAGHKFMNLKTAIANSCNTYFYNYALNIGADAIYKKASALRFGAAIKICDGIAVSKGNLPKVNTINTSSALANLSIGQGKLLLSPVTMLNLYNSIANEGEYYIPSVIEGTFVSGIFNEYNKGYPTKAMKKETAALLTDYLKAVLEEGTGETAKPTLISAAGKTATAQTGKFENGIEICQGWFCGFFPAENPKYTVIVFSEDTNKQLKTNSEIFSFIADKTANLKKLK